MQLGREGDKRPKISFFRIRGKCLEIENFTIQLKNVSFFSIERVKPRESPAPCTSAFLAGFIQTIVGTVLISVSCELFCAGNSASKWSAELHGVILYPSDLAFSFGVMSMIGGGIWIGLWILLVIEAGKLRRLTIVTNSGDRFPLLFYSERFLNEVVKNITDIIGDTAEVIVAVNIHTANLYDNSSFIRGNREGDFNERKDGRRKEY